MPEKVTVQSEGLLLDLVLWRRYGRRGQALVDAAYRLNRKLADEGVVLPAGTVLLLPDLPATPRAPLRRAVSLFE